MFFEYIKNFTDYKLFSVAHILYFVAAIVIAIGLSFVLSKWGGSKTVRIVSIVVASIVLFLHVATQIWRIASFADGRAKGIIDQVAYLVMPNELLPFQLCSMLCYIIPLTVIFNKKWMHNAIAPICVIAGFLFFFFPDGIINRYPAFSFRVLESMIVHTAILFYGIYLFASKKVEFKIKNMISVFPVFGGMFLVGLIMNLSLMGVDSGVDFFYVMKGFGLGLHPAVNAIILILIGTALVFAIYGICQLCYLIERAIKKRKENKDKTA